MSFDKFSITSLNVRMMKITVALVVLCVASLQVSKADDDTVPEKCKGPPPFIEKPYECCNLPPLFEPEDLKECGFHFGIKAGIPHHHPGPGGPPDHPPPCDKHICILKKNSLMKDDDNMDKEKLKTYLESWGKKNPEFASTLTTVYDKCLVEQIPGPPELCEPIKTVMCAATVMFTECPTWTESEGCSTMKEYINTCREYIHRVPK